MKCQRPVFCKLHMGNPSIVMWYIVVVEAKLQIEMKSLEHLNDCSFTENHCRLACRQDIQEVLIYGAGIAWNAPVRQDAARN